MQERHLFEYAVLRIVPRVEREEFLNAGVLVYCQKKKFLQVKIQLPESRIKALCETADLDEIKRHFHSFELVCKG
ncbi:MAG TPA: DUF3037 domain-containing protein, partial [Flavisolibacter sp.]|nr:DUF3037 domain-containing protein [Flavisolibacter sp.]